MTKIINDPRAKMLRGEITPLKYYLGLKNMTVKELSERSQVNKRNLDDYVSGRKDIKGIGFLSGLSLAKVLEVEPWELIPKTYDNTGVNE